MSLIHLVYISTLRQGVDEAEIAKILASCDRRNKADGVTGMLLYSGGNFLQVLEGESQTVRNTFARVSADLRHQDVTELLQEPIEQRDFPAWSMGFRNLGAEVAQRLPEQANHFRFGFDGQNIRARPGVALDLLREFGQSNR